MQYELRCFIDTVVEVLNILLVVRNGIILFVKLTKTVYIGYKQLTLKAVLINNVTNKQCQQINYHLISFTHRNWIMKLREYLYEYNRKIFFKDK